MTRGFLKLAPGSLYGGLCHVKREDEATGLVIMFAVVFAVIVCSVSWLALRWFMKSAGW